MDERAAASAGRRTLAADETAPVVDLKWGDFMWVDLKLGDLNEGDLKQGSRSHYYFMMAHVKMVRNVVLDSCAFSPQTVADLRWWVIL